MLDQSYCFHPAVSRWFEQSFDGATAAQASAWPAIQSGSHTLIAAPTGSGKTLAAFLAAIDGLVRQAVAGELKDETQIVYVSPLKALSNDIKKNLEAPLAGIEEELQALGLPAAGITAWVRTGDTPQNERSAARKKPPHIVVTTPESLYILLGSASGRRMLATTRTVIVDEIHAVAPNKRGAHLALSLERLDALCEGRLLRIGLSATQKPIETVAQFLTGLGGDGIMPACRIVDTGHVRARDLAIEVPSSPLEAVMSGEVWLQVYDRLTELILQHRTTLIFVNTRRLAERVTRALSERLGDEFVTAHHGSLAKELRLSAEQRLKNGDLKALVATASLELGIDIGDIDLVCQLASPRTIASFLQRVGRSGHAVGGLPKGRLFPLSRDELVECAALIDSVRRGELDRLVIPEQPLDVLAQQIAAEAANQEWDSNELYARFCRAWPYRHLTRPHFDEIVTMLAEGFTTRRGRRGALVHFDGVNHQIRGRRGSALTALTSGGTIPDLADYQVLLEPNNITIGTLNEDFAVESLAGDVFQLGNYSYRILRVERGTVRVEDAHGQPPSIPFWIGESFGRSDELSQSVSRLRTDIAAKLGAGLPLPAILHWLVNDIGVAEPAAQQLLDYLAAAWGALRCLPTQDVLVFERFFDEAGGMQFVIHSPFGSRINRAWGLALRKRFCRKFNFELQAAATEDNIILSLTQAHSFDLEDAARYLHSNSVRPVLIQALLDAPMFMTRWRWVAGVALALPRFRGGKKVPPQFARMDAEDLVGAVFPDQIACLENIVGEREIPDHPLVRQTLKDCLEDAMDIDGLEHLLRRMEAGEIRLEARDLTEPSPLALEVLSARPYAYLDDAPLEERRTQAVIGRRWLAPETATDLGKLDPEAIARVREEAWPDASNPDELHDALVWLGFFTAGEARSSEIWALWLGELAKQRRVARLETPGTTIWITAERLPQFQAIWPDAACHPPITAPDAYAKPWSREEALVEILRGRLEGLGPVSEEALAASLGIDPGDVSIALAALQSEGFAMRGNYTGEPGEWCERRLLARIHRYTVKRLRAEIEPVPARDFMRFLFDWQRVSEETHMEGAAAVESVLDQLEGFEAAAGAWESEILPARVVDYEPAWLDSQCLSGRVAWVRLRPCAPRPVLIDRTGAERGAGPLRTTPITLVSRRRAGLWASLSPHPETGAMSPAARTVIECIRAEGALFFDGLLDASGLLPSKLEDALSELVGLGLVNSDSFGGLRALLAPASKRNSGPRRHGRGDSEMQDAGRWALARTAQSAAQRDTAVEYLARTLLRRYGVVFWRLLEREAPWLPPWRDLLRVFRRLEASGEIRGGRFVAGFSGEQYALPESIGALREVRRRPHSGKWVSVSGADPLNLAGIVTPGPRLPAITSSRVLYRDGIPAALLTGGDVQFIGDVKSELQWEARKALLRGPGRNRAEKRAARIAAAEIRLLPSS